MRGMESGVSFTTLDPDGEDRFQRLRQELGVSTFGINLLRLRPGQGSRIHRHEHQEEAYLVLEGTLTLVVEGEPRELERGELARVGARRPPPARQPPHRVRCSLLALGGANAARGSRRARLPSRGRTTGEGRTPADVPLPPDERSALIARA